MVPKAKSFNGRPGTLIAAKKKEDYSQVMCNIRTRLSMNIEYQAEEYASGSKRCTWEDR